MKPIPLVMATVLVSVALWTSPAQAEENNAPQLVIEKKLHHAGVVREGEVIVHDFKVSNRGKQDLQIRRVQPD
jgi:hypothetical protein